MNFFQVITFVLLISTMSRGCPTKDKPTVVIEGSGDLDDPARHLSISVNSEGYLMTDDLGSVSGLRPGGPGRMVDRAQNKEFYPSRARKIDLENKSDEDGADDYATEKRKEYKGPGLVLGGSADRDSLTTVLSEQNRYLQTHKVPGSVSLLEAVPSAKSTSVPSAPDSPDGSLSSGHLGQELAQLRSSSGVTFLFRPSPSTDGPPESRNQPEPTTHHHPLPSRLPELLAVKPASPSRNNSNFQQPELSAAPGLVVQEPGASSIMQRLPPELLMYLQTLGISVESHLLEEFRSIGFSMGPHGEGQPMSLLKYRIICSLGDVEVRSYRRSTWISTVVNTSSFDVATYIGFHRLFKYIRGENARGAKLEMAKPVRTQVTSAHTGRGTEESRGGGDIRTRYTVSFYTPRKRAVDFPTPLDPRIFIEDLRPSRFYALSFGGFPISNRVDKQAHRLARLLPNSNRNQSDSLGSSFFVDVYDTPMKLTDRHNEILIPLELDDTPRRWCSDPGSTTK